MPVITPLNLLSIDVGPASTFRGNINTNFEKIKLSFDDIDSKIQEIIENNNSIVLSKTQPNNQRQNDLWLREL